MKQLQLILKEKVQKNVQEFKLKHSFDKTSTAQLNSSRMKNPFRKVTRFNSPHENTELENIVNTQRYLKVEITGLKSFMNDKWNEITKLLGGYSNNTQPCNQ